MNKTIILAIFICLVSCISPEEIDITSDSDAKALDNFLKSAISQQDGMALNKTVDIDDKTESAQLIFDTLIIKKDLKKLIEYSFARLIRSTNYNKNIQKDGILFERRLKEKKGPVSIELNENKLNLTSSIKFRFEEENYLYQSNQIIQLSFINEKLVHYRIEEDRKLIGMDPSSYTIDVSIVEL